MPMSEWEQLSDDDRDWELGLDSLHTCPVCGGDDPEGLCQNPRFQHAWEVILTRCYKQRAVLLAMKRFENDPYVSTVIPRVTLNPAKAKPLR